MRRVLGWATSPGAILAVLALLTYGYFYQAGGWNQNSRFALVRAIAEEGTVQIDGYERATGDKSEREGRFYSDKAPGASFLGVPAYAAARAAAGAEVADRRPDDFAYVVTVWAVGLSSALAVAAIYGVLGALGVGAGGRIFGAAAYGFGTLAFPFATLFYGHQVAAAFVVLGLFAVFAGARGPSGRLGPGKAIAAGLCFGMAIAVEYPAALAVLPCLVYAAVKVRPRAALAWIAIGLAGPGIAVAAYHAVAFGHPLTLPYEFSTQPHRHAGFFMGLGVPRADALWGITLSSYRGLFFTAPWLALAAVGIALLWRRGLRAEAALFAAVPLLFLWMNASLVDWEGGWTFGPRYLIPAVPFMAVAAVAVAGPGLSERWRRAALALLVVLVVIACGAMLMATAVKPEVPVYIDKPVGDFLLPRLWEGELADNPQSIESRASPEDGPRYAWNWGQRLGLSGAASLAPLVALWAAGAAALAAAARARGAR